MTEKFNQLNIAKIDTETEEKLYKNLNPHYELAIKECIKIEQWRKIIDLLIEEEINSEDIHHIYLVTKNKRWSIP